MKIGRIFLSKVHFWCFVNNQRQQNELGFAISFILFEYPSFFICCKQTRPYIHHITLPNIKSDDDDFEVAAPTAALTTLKLVSSLPVAKPVVVATIAPKEVHR